MFVPRLRYLLIATVLSLNACGADEPVAPAGTSLPSPVVSPPTQPPLTAGPPSEAELPPGFDETPDGPSPTPDADLPDAALTALLRTRGSSAAGDESCGPAEVTAELSGFDAALGHRYTSLVVTNTSSRSCVVDGVPGVGARGDLGHRLTLTVERGLSTSGSAGPVRLAPGAQAQAQLEWTGDLAAQDSERASLLVVQLAAGQVPVGLPARIVDAPDGAGDLDVGMFTTIRVGPFEPRG